MSVLFANVTAVTMDPAQPVLENAFVAVEGTKIVSVGTVRPEGTFDRVVEGKGKVLMPCKLPHPCAYDPDAGLRRGSRFAALAQ